MLGGLLGGLGSAIGGAIGGAAKGIGGIGKGLLGGLGGALGGVPKMLGGLPGGAFKPIIPMGQPIAPIAPLSRPIMPMGQPQPVSIGRMGNPLVPSGQSFTTLPHPVSRMNMPMGQPPQSSVPSVNMPGQMGGQIGSQVGNQPFRIAPPVAYTMQNSFGVNVPSDFTGGTQVPFDTVNSAEIGARSAAPAFGQNRPEGGMNMTPDNYNVGDLAARYEVEAVKNKPLSEQVGYISSGMGGKDPGGISYGPYQLETKKGTMQGYLGQKGDPFAERLKQYPVNSEQFKNEWRSISREHPEAFKESQFNYLASKPNGYNDALKYAEKLGWDTDNPHMKAAIYSISNQSGGWKKGIFDQAGIAPDDSLETQINKLYDARGSYFDRGLRKGWYDRDVHRGITNKRVNMERQDLLNRVSHGTWKY